MLKELISVLGNPKGQVEDVLLPAVPLKNQQKSQIKRLALIFIRIICIPIR